MKKFLLSFGLIGVGIFGGLFTSVYASNNDCKEVEFANGATACVNIQAGDDNDERELETDVDDGSASNLRCDIMTPDSILRSIPSCNGTFEYDEDKAGMIKLWIRYNNIAPEDREDKPNNDSTWTYPQWSYDFDEEERGDANYNSSNSSNGDLESFEIKLSDSTPAEDDEVTLTIKALDDDDDVIDDYDGDDAEITIQYRTSSSSSWKTASSSYVSIDDKTPTFDNGEAETDITFKYEYEYKIIVEDEDEDISDYKVFDVGGSSSSSSNGDLDTFEIKLSDSTPARNDEVTLTLKALDDDDDVIDDYDGDDAEITIYYRTSSSSSWKTASSTYVSIDDKTPTFDNGEAETDITFKYNYTYKIVVEDEDEDITTYKTFTVGSSSSSSNGDLDTFEIKLSDSTPARNDEVTLTLKALDDDDDVIDDYDGDDAEITIYYRTSSSSSWKTASSTYVSIDDKTPTFDNGEAETDITFKYNYTYKIVVEDEDEDITTYKTFTVGSSSSSSNGDLESFEIKLSDSTPARNDEVTLTLKALDDDDDVIDDYDGDDAEITIYYRTSSSSSWKTASSSYVSIDDKTPTFDNGEAETDITFKYNYTYKIVVEDEDEDITTYKTFTVGSSSSSSNGDLESFEIKLSDSTPAEDDEVTLTIKALDDNDDVIDDYDGDAEVKIYYKKTSSSNWTSATTTYVAIDDKTPTFDNGEAETDITFKYDYDYLIIVMDSDENVASYEEFEVHS